MALSQKYDLNLYDSKIIEKEKIRLMCQEFYIIAAEKYKRAFSSLPRENFKEQRPGIIMGMIYMKLLKKIKKSKFNVFDKKVSLNYIEKLQAAWKGSWSKLSELDI